MRSYDDRYNITLVYNPKHDVGTRFRGILYTIEEFEKYQFEYVRISRDRNMNLGRECVVSAEGSDLLYFPPMYRAGVSDLVLKEHGDFADLDVGELPPKHLWCEATKIFYDKWMFKTLKEIKMTDYRPLGYTPVDGEPVHIKLYTPREAFDQWNNIEIRMKYDTEKNTVSAQDSSDSNIRTIYDNAMYEEGKILPVKYKELTETYEGITVPWTYQSWAVKEVYNFKPALNGYLIVNENESEHFVAKTYGVLKNKPKTFDGHSLIKISSNGTWYIEGINGTSEDGWEDPDALR